MKYTENQQGYHYIISKYTLSLSLRIILASIKFYKCEIYNESQRDEK